MTLHMPLFDLALWCGAAFSLWLGIMSARSAASASGAARQLRSTTPCRRIVTYKDRDRVRLVSRNGIVTRGCAPSWPLPSPRCREGAQERAAVIAARCRAVPS